MKRHDAREYIFKFVYEMEVQNDKDTEAVLNDTAEVQDISLNGYIKRSVNGISDKKEEIDKLIADAAVGWKIERFSAVSHAIMRVAVYEMLFSESDAVPYKIAINEAVEIAKKYDHEKSPKFINGVLNSIADKQGLKVDTDVKQTPDDDTEKDV